MNVTRSKAAIAIIGGGPAGLTLARLLTVKNIHNYVLFERSSPPGHQSRHDHNARQGTLDLHAENGQLAPREAGLADKFKRFARWDTPTILARANGEVVARLNEGGEADRPEIDRSALQTMLLASLPSGKIRWGAKVQEVRRDEKGSMAVEFDDGRVEAGFSLVVGADGAWSKTRRLVTGVKPRYFGMHYVTSRISARNPHYAQAAALIGKGTYMALGGEKMLMGQRLGDDSFFVGVGLHLPDTWDPKIELADATTFRAKLLEGQLKGFGEEQRNLVRWSEGECYSWPLWELPREALRWENVPGVTLIGDAAHLTVPSGEGVNVGMDDSLQLAQQIAEFGLDNLDCAAVEYEKLMFPRALAAAEDAEHSKTLWEPDSPRAFLEAASLSR